MNPAPFTAIVLAADRSTRDPLVDAAGACCKAMIKIDGTPMLERVVKALRESDQIGDIVISGPEELQLPGSDLLAEAQAQGAIRWIAPQDSPSNSAYQAMKSLPANTPLLVTTADHPLVLP